MERNLFQQSSRREWLRSAGVGFGAMAASDLLGEVGTSPNRRPSFQMERAGDPLGVRESHFKGTAKRVIHLFMNGGPSQMDTFYPKPELTRLDGKPLPDSVKKTLQRTQQGRAANIFGSPFKFQQHGESGLAVSELFPNVAKHADDLCVIRSMQGEIANHSPGLLLTNCGHSTLARPSLGSWAVYGLGVETSDLPGFVVLMPSGMPTAQSRNWTSAFLPGVYQATHVETNVTKGELIPNLTRKGIRSGTQRSQLALAQYLNRRHQNAREEDGRLDSRIHSMELAFRMQSAATDAFDVKQEPEYIRDMYGDTQHGNNLLIARRLAERGVRYIQCYHGAGQPWDNHSGIVPRIKALCRESDQPIGALLTDLKARGMLEDTLVIWGGEMGRTPTIQAGPKDIDKVGRDHHIDGYTIWMAGGGIKGGQTYGSTDDLAMKIVDKPVSIHDYHATVLNALGFNHKELTYRYSSRDFRLTDVHGEVIRDWFA